ncbi:Histone acetyltransferase [Bertholletia excelsa]
MKRELAFAMQTQSDLAGSLGRTRASKGHLQSGDLREVAQDRSSKRLRDSSAHNSDLNCEVNAVQGKLNTNGFLDLTREGEVSTSRCNGISVYRRTRRSDNASSENEHKIYMSKSLETVVEDRIKCNLVTPVCEDESKTELAETSINSGDPLLLAVDETNEAKNAADKEAGNGVPEEAPRRFTRSVLNKEVRSGVMEKAPRRFTRSALNSQSAVEELECSATVASGSKLSGGGENDVLSNVELIGSSEVTSLGTPTKKLELKMSKKIALGRIPKTVKELFATGLLEGYSVFYNSRNKGFEQRGIIKDTGILCFCSSCKGSRVVNPCKFEIHACKSYRRAAQYICLENGRSLLQVLKACSNSPLDTLEETIQSYIGSLPEKESVICQNCKGSFLATFAEKLKPLCKLCFNSNSLEAPDTTEISVRSLEPELSSKESKGNAETWILSPNTSKGTIAKHGSSEPDLIPESSGHGPAHIIRRSPRSASVSKSSASASTHILLKSKSEGKIGKRLSNPVIGRKPHGRASLHSLSENKSQWKKTKKSSKADALQKFSKSAPLHLSPERSTWKITRKDLGVHKLVFEEGGLPDGTELAYYSRGQKLLEGYKRGLGIFCRCCSSEISPSQFEAHAGWASRKKPYGNIYTSNGVSLHEFAIFLLKGRKYRSKQNDDLCIICADGGNLLLCDGCPRAFHKECASLSSIPRGKWYCNYCQNMFQREKFVEHNANAVAAGRVSGVDPIQQITKRCIRIFKNPDEAEVIACVLCRDYDFRRSGFGPRTVIVCDQCEREYHVGCLKKYNMADLKELPKGKWFCCTVCMRIYSALQNLLIRGEEKIPDSLLNVMKKKHEDQISDIATDFDVKWRLLSGKLASPETRLLLSKAVSIFHDCFDPIVDSVTGRDFIPSMVYGRNISGQEFGGMYSAVLTVNSSVVSVGIFRVFGQEIAELPLVATSNGKQGKGYFQILFSCIMKLLAFLNVKCLVLPAADEAISIWTEKFGFERIPQEQLINYRKTCWQMLSFKGTSMLQKRVPQCRIISQDGDICDETN